MKISYLCERSFFLYLFKVFLLFVRLYNQTWLNNRNMILKLK